MATDRRYWEYFRGLSNRPALKGAFESVRDGIGLAGFPTDDDNRGRALEFLMIRGFEVDLLADFPAGDRCTLGARQQVARVVWPYRVGESQVTGSGASQRTVEQVDGGIHLPGLSCLLECKVGAQVGIEPVAKLMSKLLRRPWGVIGSVVSLGGFSDPALILAHTLSPLTVILWEQEDVALALEDEENGGLVGALLWKYRQAVDLGVPFARIRDRAQDAVGLADRCPKE